MRSGPPISPLQADRPLRAPPREGASGRQAAAGSILPVPRMSRLACLIARVSFAMFLRATPGRIHFHTREPVQGLLRYSHFTDKKIFLGESPPGQDPRKAWQKKMRGLGRSFWASCSSPARGCSAPFLGLRCHDAGAQAPTALTQVPWLCPRTVPKGRPHQEGRACHCALGSGSRLGACAGLSGSAAPDTASRLPPLSCLPAPWPATWITQAHPCDGRLSVSIAMVPSQVTKREPQCYLEDFAEG